MLEMTKDILELEITSKCTLACPCCPTRGIERSNWDKDTSDFELVKSVLLNSNFSRLTI